MSTAESRRSEHHPDTGLKIIIESMIEICRDHSTNVKRWRDGEMALRWCAAGMIEATKQFRKVNGFLHLPALRRALDAELAKITVTPPEYDQEVA